MEILDLLFDAGRWSAEGIWLPIAVWTMVALPLYAAVRFCERISVHIRYHTALAVLAALPLGVAVAAVVSVDTTAVRGMAAIITLPDVTFEGAADISTVPEWTTYHTAGAALVVGLLLALWRGGMLILAMTQLLRYRVAASKSVSQPLDALANRIAGELGIDRRVQVGITNESDAPMTFGYRRPLILLPRELLASQDDLRMALVHELIHVRRRDYLLQWFEEIVGAVFLLHPLVALLRRETSVLREITCDADVLTDVADRSRYARLLFHYAAPLSGHRHMAVGILQKENHLKTRLRAMKRMLDFDRMNRSKRTGLAIASLLLAVAVIFVACSDVLVQPRPAADEAPVVGENATSAETFVIVEDMPELVGGLASIQESLVYPQLAKEAGIEGRVIVQFIVDEQGAVIDPVVVRGVGSGLDAAALEAVKTAEFKPGRQDGQSVRVKMSLPITFKLGTGGDQSLDNPTPSSSDGESPGETQHTIRVVVDQDDNIFVNGRRVDVQGLQSAVNDAGVSESTTVVLRVDRDASMERISEIQAQLRNTAANEIHYRSR